MNALVFFERQLELIESLFSASWIGSGKQPVHPARRSMELCKIVIRQDGALRMPRSLVPEMSKVFMDSCVRAQLTRGDVRSLKIGNIEAYASPRVLSRVRGQAIRPGGYLDLEVEFYVAAHHLAAGHEVVPVEEEGMPDLRVRIDGIAEPVFVECKNVRGAGKNAIKDKIRKANKQLRNASDMSAGVIVVDVSRRVGVHQVTDDAIPKSVVSALEQAESQLRNSSHIQTCIVVWEDYIQHGSVEDYLLTVYRRRAQVVDNSKAPSDRDIKLFEGQSVGFPIVSSLIDLPPEYQDIYVRGEEELRSQIRLENDREQ